MAKILVVEDERDLLEGVLEILELEGFEAIGAPNGRVGVDKAREYLPDLIICDIMMPVLDGYGVLYELRSDNYTSTIPFIFLTARGERADMRKGMELGADDYLTKPYEHTELVAAVNASLQKREILKREYGKKLDDLRENILRSLPHELRTPLTLIIGYGEMLTLDYDSLPAEQVKSMADSIFKAGNRLHSLIEKYLLHAQLEIIKLDPERVRKLRQQHTEDASALVQELAEKRAIQASRPADLVVRAVPTSAAILGDNLKEIVNELVDNAFKFSPAGSPIFVEVGESEGAFLMRVSDSGRGMTAEQIQSIGAYMQFERKLYEQQGMGLGLVISKNLAELYGGQLFIESVLGQGTQVYVQLPL